MKTKKLPINRINNLEVIYLSTNDSNKKFCDSKKYKILREKTYKMQRGEDISQSEAELSNQRKED